MTFLTWEMSAVVRWLTRSFVLPFVGIGLRIDLFQDSAGGWRDTIQLIVVLIVMKFTLGGIPSKKTAERNSPGCWQVAASQGSGHLWSRL